MHREKNRKYKVKYHVTCKPLDICIIKLTKKNDDFPFLVTNRIDLQIYFENY